MPISRRVLLRSATAGVIAGAISPGSLRAAGAVNETTGAAHSGLAQALASARAGDTITVAGYHQGNFTIPVPMTLRGSEDAMLDAAGRGTALVIAADDVTITGIALTGSGPRRSFASIWGPAGLRVEGQRASLSGLTVTGNEDGVLLLNAADVRIDGCRISENRGDGIKVMGGHGHRVSGNAMNRNGVGLTIAPYYGDATEMILPDVPQTNDTAAMQRYQRALQMLTELKEGAKGATDIIVESNTLRGNGTLGIHLYTGSARCTVQQNEVHLTGRERQPDQAAVAWYGDYLSRSLGGADVTDVLNTHAGTGIILSCLTEEHRIIANHSHDNLGEGMAANMTYRSQFETNRLERNRTGFWLDYSDDNEARGNVIAANTDGGLVIDNWLRSQAPAPSGSSGNLIVLNVLTGNRINAYDSSDHVPTQAEVQARLDKAPLPAQLREMLRQSPDLCTRMMAQHLSAHRPGRNRWDDGQLGNHYSDFDTPEEGFRDADANGVSEQPHAIPGGGHVDRFPLSLTRAQAR